MIATFSSVTRVVARAAISLTSPTHPAISTRSPILIGRSNSRIKAAEEVARDVLQTETEPHTDGAHEHVQRREVDTGRLKDHEGAQTDDDVSNDGAEGFAHPDVEAAARQHMVDQPSRHTPCHPDQRRHQTR